MNVAAWLGLLGAVVASVAFSFWIYLRREVPVSGRRSLAAVRAAVLALLVLLLFDPTIPGRAAGTRAPRRWVAVDASLSMAAGTAGEPTPWERAVEGARGSEGDDVRIVTFGEGSQSEDSSPGEGAQPREVGSRLAPLLQRALESGAREVVVYSDLRLEDPLAVRALLERGELGIRFVDVGGRPQNAGIARWQLPPSVHQGDPVPVELALHATEAAQGRTATVEVREEGRLVHSSEVVLPPPGRLLALSLELPPPQSGGTLRYQARVILDGDAFPDDDERAGFVDRDPEAGLLVGVGLVPDWELRFLLPLLAEVTGLEGRSYLRVGPDRFVRVGGEVGPVASDELRRRMEGAEILVLAGLGADVPRWIEEVMESKRHLLVFAEDAEGAALAGVAAGSPLGGEWYVSPEVPPSALAAELGGADLQALPPLSRLLPVSSDGQGGTPLLVQLRGSGPGEPALLLTEGSAGRRAVALARGFWRWGFRNGQPRETYRRLWAGTAGWLLADRLAAGGALLFPTSRVVPRGQPIRWSGAGAAGREVSLSVSLADSVVSDTVVTVGPGGLVVTPSLPPGTYTYRAEALDGEADTREGRFEVESYTDELFHRPAQDLAEVPATSARAPSPTSGRPLRTHPVPYLLLLGLLCGEWIGRRRKGLR